MEVDRVTVPDRRTILEIMTLSVVSTCVCYVTQSILIVQVRILDHPLIERFLANYLLG